MRRLFRKAVTLAAVWLFALVVTGATLFAADAIPECLQHFVIEIVDELGRTEARILFKWTGKLSPNGQAGAQAFMLLRDVDNDAPQRLLQTARNFSLYVPGNQVPSAFASHDELMAAIHACTSIGPDRGLVAPPGLRRTVGELGVLDGVGTAQGANFDIYMARLYGGYSNVAGFRVQVQLPNGMVRVYDLSIGAPGTPPHLAILVENKSLVELYEGFGSGILDANGRFVYSDPRLTSLAQEFDRDILVHAATGFSRWRLNYRHQLAGQRAAIEEVLKAQFESKIVKDGLLPAARARALEQFEAKLPANLQFR
jgi:hypothetical protein